MKIYSLKASNKKMRAFSNNLTGQQSGDKPASHFVDNRPEAVAQLKLQEAISNSHHFKQKWTTNTSAESTVIQRHPIVNDIKSDEAIANELDAEIIMPFKVKLKDEISRNGTPQ